MKGAFRKCRPKVHVTTVMSPKRIPHSHYRPNRPKASRGLSAIARASCSTFSLQCRHVHFSWALCGLCYIAVIEILQSEVKRIILRYNNCYRHSAKCGAVLRVSRLLHCTFLFPLCWAKYRFNAS